MASLQSAFLELDEALKITNRRVNALDNVVIPRLKATEKYITDELDELEREENFRVKKVIDVKKIKIAEEKKLLAAFKVQFLLHAVITRSVFIHVPMLEVLLYVCCVLACIFHWIPSAMPFPIPSVCLLFIVLLCSCTGGTGSGRCQGTGICTEKSIGGGGGS